MVQQGTACRYPALLAVSILENPNQNNEVKTAWDGKVLAQIPVEYTNVWKHYSTPVEMPDGVQALYFTFKGEGKGSLKGFYLEH